MIYGSLQTYNRSFDPPHTSQRKGLGDKLKFIQLVYA